MEQVLTDAKISEKNLNPHKVMKTFPKGIRKNNVLMVVATLLVVILGIASGWVLSGQSSAKSQSSTVDNETEGVTKSDKEAGVSDVSSFDSQSPEGVLVEGGIEGEGTYHLERPGGVSQNVYLTSTVIDLQSFVGKKVKVWGETLSGIKAGWLMDVGKIKVID